MSFWDILDIEPTDNVSLVKKAYAKKLKIFHPEDDPEGFQKLKEAYDSALKYLKNNKKKALPPRDDVENKEFATKKVSLTEDYYEKNIEDNVHVPPPINILDEFDNDTSSYEENIEDNVHIPPPINILDEFAHDTPSFEEIVEDFIGEAELLYNDFFSRINIENWREFLNSQVMWYMGNRKFLSDKVIEFLIENHYLPKDIWDLLESNFNWREQEEYLYENYPEEFIDYLLKQINGTSELRYCYFKEPKAVDYEAFLEYREEAFNALLDNDFEYANECINNAYKIYPDDPDLLIMKGRYYLHLQDIDKALDIFQSLIQRDKEDIYAIYYRAKALYEKGEIHSAFEECKYIEQHMLDNLGFLFIFAKCYFKLEKFDKAKELILKLLGTNPLDADAKAFLEQINLQLVYKLREELKENKDKRKIKLQLDKLYKELGKLGNKHIARKFLWIMIKKFFICCLIFMIQVSIIRASIKTFGFSDIIPKENIEKFITSNNKVHIIKSSEDINKLPSGINVVEGKLTNAGFIDLHRISTKDKNDKDTILYLSEKEAKDKNVFDDMDGYICMGNIGDKRVIMIVDYDQATEIYNTKELNFKGIIHYKPSKDLINEVKKRYWSNKFEADFVTDKVIDTDTKLLHDRKIVIGILSLLLLIQFLVIIQGLKSGYKLIKLNRKF